MSLKAATRNVHLSKYGFGIYQDIKSPLAEFIAPRVGTGVASGQYKKYDDENSFQVYETARAVGGPNTRIEFGADDPFFNCRPRGLAIAIDDHERTQAGDAGQTALEESKTKTLVSTTVNSHEKAVFDKALTLSATGGIGVWSDVTKDPIDEIDGEIQSISTECGIMPNRMVIGIGAWRIIKNHPKVLARQPGAGNQGVTLEQFAGMLLNPAIEIRIGLMSRNTKKRGATKNIVNIVGADVFIFFAQDNPTQYDPSFMKTFMPTAAAIDEVMQYRDEDNNSDVLKTNWEDEIQVVSTALARRIALT